MPSRFQLHKQIPWDGGLNTIEDVGFTDQNDLVIADNVVFTNSGTRTKREGIDYFDSTIPAPNARSSSGTTRTLYFDSSADMINSSSNDKLVVGERITVIGSGAGNEASYDKTDGVILTIATSGIGHKITYTATGSLSESRTDTTTIEVTRASSIVELKDFWYTSSNVKTQRLLAATDDFQLFRYDSNGNRKQITDDTSATIPAAPCLTLNSVIYLNKYILFFPAVGDKPVKYNPDDNAEYQLLGGTPPDASFGVEYLGRLWTNNKTNKDRMEYSETGDHEVWNGVGDSGAIDIISGDGDKSGITAAFPYKGFLVVQKEDRYYRILGDSPENFIIQPVTESIGSIGQKTVAMVDSEDGAFFASRRGIHSISTTDQYGDIDREFISGKIERTYKEDFNASRRQYMQATYIPQLNSVVYGVSQAGETANNDLYLYNTEIKKWVRWPDISCQAVSRRDDNGVVKLILGTNDGRILQAQNGDFDDFSGPIVFRVKSPIIYPGQDLLAMKSFSRLYVLLRPISNFTLTVKCKIDNQSTQTFTIGQVSNGDNLGETFIVGSSVLGTSANIAPYNVPFIGLGRGLSIELVSSGSSEEIIVYGFVVEYEPVDIIPEIITG